MAAAFARKVLVLLFNAFALLLVLLSVFETYGFCDGLVRSIQPGRPLLFFAAALAAVLVPSAAVLVWATHAVLLQLRAVRRAVQSGVGIGDKTLLDFAPAKPASVTGPDGPTMHGGAGQWVTLVGIALAAALATLCAAAVLANAGTAERGTGIALQLTGRLSLVLFWPAYAGSAVTRLFGPRFSLLARHGRDFGLAYAAAQLVHVGLVLHMLMLSGPFAIAAIMPFFGVGVAWTYGLAFLSFKFATVVVSDPMLRVLRNIGLEYLALVFLADLVVRPLTGHLGHPLFYIPFALLIAIGPLLRFAAILQRADGVRRAIGWLRCWCRPPEVGRDRIGLRGGWR